jgi:aryl-alcohol dehydrogenase-like predicted oxidoreductase
MEYHILGRSGIKVSEICLGALTFGKNTDESEGARIVEVAIEAGVNFFDTADSYNNGTSEEILGKALKLHRQKVIVASKFFNPMGPGPNDSGMSRVHIMQSIENSLRRLQTDYIDLYYIHHLDEETSLEEGLRALDDLVHQGKVRYIACSNYEAWRLLEALWISETRNLYRIECYQPQYNLVVRDIEQDIIPVCKLKNLGVVTYSPLANGFLSGKYKPGERQIKGTRSEEGWVFLDQTWAPNADEILKALLDAAHELKRSPAQVAIRWVLEQPAISSVIIGGRSVEQVKDNLHAGGWKLPPEINARLCEVSTLPDRYPKNFEKTFRKRRADAVQMPSLKED